jgi:phosphonate transport system permease protein
VVLSDAMNLFDWQRVAMALLAIFVVVILAEIAMANIRKRLI